MMNSDNLRQQLNLLFFFFVFSVSAFNDYLKMMLLYGTKESFLDVMELQMTFFKFFVPTQNSDSGSKKT
jgi:hypothetical protein